MTDLRTLSDVKRALQPGVTVRVVNHVRPDASGLRTITQSNTAGVRYVTEDGRKGWIGWPRRDEIEIAGRSVAWLSAGVSPAFVWTILEAST